MSWSKVWPRNLKIAEQVKKESNGRGQRKGHKLMASHAWLQHNIGLGKLRNVRLFLSCVTSKLHLQKRSYHLRKQFGDILYEDWRSWMKVGDMPLHSQNRRLLCFTLIFGGKMTWLGPPVGSHGPSVSQKKKSHLRGNLPMLAICWPLSFQSYNSLLVYL